MAPNSRPIDPRAKSIIASSEKWPPLEKNMHFVIRQQAARSAENRKLSGIIGHYRA
jgi:hypothetical protein